MDHALKDQPAFKILSSELPLYYNPFMPQLLFDATLINKNGSARTSDPRKKWAAFDVDVFKMQWYHNRSWNVPRWKSTIVFAGIMNPPISDMLSFYTDLETPHSGLYGGSLIFYKVYPALASLLPYSETTKLEDVDTRLLVLPSVAHYDFVAQYIYNRQLLQLRAYKVKTPYVTLQSFSRSHTGIRFTERGVPRERNISVIVNSRARNARRSAGVPEADLNKNVGDFGTNAPSGWYPQLYVADTHRAEGIYELFYGINPPPLARLDGNVANDNILNLVHADGSPLPPMKTGPANVLKAMSERAKTYFAPDWLRCPEEIIEYRSYRLYGDDRLSTHPDVLEEEYERITSPI